MLKRCYLGSLILMLILAVAAGAQVPTQQFATYGATYSGTTQYPLSSFVFYNGKLYLSLVAQNEGHEPDTNPTYWYAVTTPSTTVTTTPVTTTGEALSNTYDLKKDCGAKGDGVADDTAAIQTCLNKAGQEIETNPFVFVDTVTPITTPSAAIIFVPVGTYKTTSTLTYNSQTTFYGVGDSSQFLFEPSVPNTAFMTYNPNAYSWGQTIDQVTFQKVLVAAGNADAATGDGFEFVNTNRITVDDVNVMGFYDNIAIYGSAVTQSASFYNMLHNVRSFNGVHSNLYIDANSNSTVVEGGSYRDGPDFTTLKAYNVYLLAQAVEWYGASLEANVTVAQVKTGQSVNIFGCYQENPYGSAHYGITNTFTPTVDADMSQSLHMAGGNEVNNCLNDYVKVSNFTITSGDTINTLPTMPSKFDSGDPKWVDLITNGSLTKGIYGWSQSTYVGTAGTVAQSSTTTFNSPYSIQMVANGTGINSVAQTIPGATLAAYVGRRLYVSFLLHTDGSAQTVSVGLSGAGNVTNASTGTYAAKTSVFPQVQFDNNWYLYVADIPILSAADLSVFVQQSSNVSGATLYVGGVNPYMDGWEMSPPARANQKISSYEPPTTGSWVEGDIVWNEVLYPTGGNSEVGWICTAAGSPGTWTPFGYMQLDAANITNYSGTFAVQAGANYFTGTTNVFANPVTFNAYLNAQNIGATSLTVNGGAVGTATILTSAANTGFAVQSTKTGNDSTVWTQATKWWTVYNGTTANQVWGLDTEGGNEQVVSGGSYGWTSSAGFAGIAASETYITRPSVGVIKANASYGPTEFLSDIMAQTNIDIAFSSAPVFNVSNAGEFALTLTADATFPYIGNITPGRQVQFKICQDSVGGHAFNWPSNVIGAAPVASAANACSTYDTSSFDSSTTLWATAQSTTTVTQTGGGTATAAGSTGQMQYNGGSGAFQATNYTTDGSGIYGLTALTASAALGAPTVASGNESDTQSNFSWTTFGGGRNFGPDPAGGYGWRTSHGLFQTFNFATRGIKHAESRSVASLAPGDFMDRYHYVYYSDGCGMASSDEGCGIETTQFIDSLPMTGTIAVGGTGNLSPTYTPTNGQANVTDGSYLLDITAGTISGTFTAVPTSPSGLPVIGVSLTGGGTLPLTTAWAIATQALPDTNLTTDHEVTVSSFVVTPQAIGGTTPHFVPGYAVIVGNHIEKTQITAVSADGTTITLNHHYPASIGAKIFQGGVAGQYLSVDSLMTVSAEAGAYQNDPPSRRGAYPVIGSLTGTDLIYGIPIFNQMYGMDIGAGDTAVESNSSFHLYPGAEIVAVQNAAMTEPLLEPNPWPWTVGDVVEDPHPTANAVEALWYTAHISNFLRAGVGGSDFLRLSYDGAGVSAAWHPFSLYNYNPCTMYRQCGGPLDPPSAMSVYGMHGTILDVHNAPGGGTSYNSLINVWASPDGLGGPFNVVSLFGSNGSNLESPGQYTMNFSPKTGTLTWNGDLQVPFMTKMVLAGLGGAYFGFSYNAGTPAYVRLCNYPSGAADLSISGNTCGDNLGNISGNVAAFNSLTVGGYAVCTTNSNCGSGGSGGSGSGTVASGSQYSPAYYTATGTAIGGVTPFTGFAFFNAAGAPRAAVVADLYNLFATDTTNTAVFSLHYVSGNTPAAPASGQQIVGGATYGQLENADGTLAPLLSGTRGTKQVSGGTLTFTLAGTYTSRPSCQASDASGAAVVVTHVLSLVNGTTWQLTVGDSGGSGADLVDFECGQVTQ